MTYSCSQYYLFNCLCRGCSNVIPDNDNLWLFSFVIIRPLRIYKVLSISKELNFDFVDSIV